MLEDKIDGADLFKERAHHAAVFAENNAVGAVGRAVEGSAKAISEHAQAIGVGTGVAMGFAQLDYVRARDRVRREYEEELAAKLNKPHHSLSNKDLDRMGHQNVVIGDALKRARLKRNIALVVGIIAVVAAGVIAAQVGGLLGGSAGFVEGMSQLFGAAKAAVGISGASGSLALGATAVAKSLVVGLSAVASYIGVEKAATVAAEPLFGLREPSISKVIKEPGLQKKLSLSSQVNYLEHLQKRVRADHPESFISQEQVLQVFLKANEGTAQAIKQKYGAEYADLPPEQRAQIVTNLGKNINLEKLTSDLNCGTVRAQEVAFLVQGQTSGVPPRETPRVKELERAHGRMEQQLQQAQGEIASLRTQMKNGAAQSGNMAPVMQAQREERRGRDVKGQATERVLRNEAARREQQRQTQNSV